MLLVLALLIGVMPCPVTAGPADRGMLRQGILIMLTGYFCKSNETARRKFLQTFYLAKKAQYNYYVNDWLFIAPSATADTFAAIHRRHGAYRAALRRLRRRLLLLYYYIIIIY